MTDFDQIAAGLRASEADSDIKKPVKKSRARRQTPAADATPSEGTGDGDRSGKGAGPTRIGPKDFNHAPLTSQKQPVIGPRPAVLEQVEENGRIVIRPKYLDEPAEGDEGGSE